MLGFYMTWVVIFITITCLVWGFEWFEKSVYRVSSAGEIMPAYYTLSSDTTLNSRVKGSIADISWQQMIQKKERGECLEISFAQSAGDALVISINHRPGTYYNMDYNYFDLYTSAALPAGEIMPVHLKMQRRQIRLCE